MKKLFWVLGGVAVLALLSKGYRKNPDTSRLISKRGDSPSAPKQIQDFQITSLAFSPGQPIPKAHACDGDDVSPPLKISGTPQGAQSLALIMEDPDSPMPPVFDHWVLWNIPADTTHLEAGEVPDGVTQGKNSLKNHHYNGPCTPNGTHHYLFKLYALDTMLDLPEGCSKSELTEAMTGHILAETQMIGLYTANSATQIKLAVAMAESFALN